VADVDVARPPQRCEPEADDGPFLRHGGIVGRERRNLGRVSTASPWPAGFARVPDEEWARAPTEALALKYDTVQNHGWYRNLDRTVEQLAADLRPGDVLLDYSGGTGILAGRLLEEVAERRFGILIVDSSPKFLRVALENLGGHERIAFRLIRYIREEQRLQLVQDVAGRALVERGVDAVVSTNAVHLYYGLEETLRSWHALLRPGRHAFVQSGNIGVPGLPEDEWIIDETVEAIHQAAVELIRESDEWAAYRGVLADTKRTAAYHELRRKFFLPVRPLAHYVGALEAVGFTVENVEHAVVVAHVDQWYEFLATYHEGVLGFVGGSERVEGSPPSPEAVDDRLRLLRSAIARVFGGRPSFRAVWTYVTARR
jgi:SAM-dependent methyltransferase